MKVNFALVFSSPDLVSNFIEEFDATKMVPDSCCIVHEFLATKVGGASTFLIVRMMSRTVVTLILGAMLVSTLIGDCRFPRHNVRLLLAWWRATRAFPRWPSCLWREPFF